jgi:hypothetical protein
VPCLVKATSVLQGLILLCWNDLEFRVHGLGFRVQGLGFEPCLEPCLELCPSSKVYIRAS